MRIDFQKYPDGLVPAVVQDAVTGKVLMLGFMNEPAVKMTMQLKKVTFFSRSRNRLWTKGEESGNYLLLKEINVDCDNDSLLVKAVPAGPVCHTGNETCWNEKNSNGFLAKLEATICLRKYVPLQNSYTSSLFEKGINAIAQKVGEEAIELVIEAKDDNDTAFKNEAADLLFHYLVLLQAKGVTFADIISVLEKREK